jgi:predicted metalloprotease
MLHRYCNARTKAGFAALLISAALLSGGCMAPPATPGSYPHAPGPSSPADPRTRPGAGGPNTDPNSEAQMQEDIDTAVVVVDKYWATHWSDYFTGEYQSPTIAGGYEGKNGPTCNGQPSEPMNARYCPESDDIAWDMELMRSYYSPDGNDVFPYVVIAHEWGHAIQYRLDPALSQQAPELQADCLAGLVLYGAQRDGTLQFDNGDGNDIAKTYAIVGDEIPWNSPEEHGDAVDRMAAFAAGRAGDITACLPNAASQ